MKEIFGTASSLVKLFQSVLDIIEKYGDANKGKKRLLNLYVSLNEFKEAKDRFFDLLSQHTDRIMKFDYIHARHLFELNVLAKAYAARHYDVYRKIGDLDYRLKPFDKSLAEIITKYKHAVSKSRGYNSDMILTNHLYWTARTGKLLKLKDFENIYRIKVETNKVYLGQICISENPRAFLDFVQLHGESNALIEQFLERLGNFLASTYEAKEATEL